MILMKLSEAKNDEKNQPLAYKQSMRPCIISIRYFTAKFTKFVSIITWNGGPSWSLYCKNIAEETVGLKNLFKNIEEK